MSEIDDVRAFHIRFGLLNYDRPVHLTRWKLAERANFMMEELFEFATAAGLTLNQDPGDPDAKPSFQVFSYGDQYLEDQADALVDLVYVALGTAVQLGLPWVDLWDDVHAANMRKERGPVDHRKHGGPDVRKPPGWVGPRGAEILERAGYVRAQWTTGIYEGSPIGKHFCIDDEPKHPDYDPREIPT